MRIRITVTAALVLAALICFASCFAEAPVPAENPAQTESAPAEIPLQTESGPADNGFIEASIVRVVDGDTVKVMLDGQKTTIRIIGINTPESVLEDESLNTEEGRIASDYVKQLLPKGTKVYVEYDLEDTDQYGRTLAYLWLDRDADPGSFEDFCRYNVGALIMQNTYCESVYYKPNKKYLDWLRLLEDEYQK